MEPNSMFPCSQVPTTGLYPYQVHPVHTFPHYFPEIHFNIVISYMPGFPNSLFRLSDQTCLCISCLFLACCMPHPSYPPWYDHPNNIIYGEAFKSWSSLLCSPFQAPITSYKHIHQHKVCWGLAPFFNGIYFITVVPVLILLLCEKWKVGNNMKYDRQVDVFMLQCQISTILWKEDQLLEFPVGKKKRLESEVPTISADVFFRCSSHSFVQGHFKGKGWYNEILSHYLCVTVPYNQCSSI